MYHHGQYPASGFYQSPALPALLPPNFSSQFQSDASSDQGDSNASSSAASSSVLMFEANATNRELRLQINDVLLKLDRLLDKVDGLGAESRSRPSSLGVFSLTNGAGFESRSSLSSSFQLIKENEDLKLKLTEMEAQKKSQQENIARLLDNNQKLLDQNVDLMGRNLSSSAAQSGTTTSFERHEQELTVKRLEAATDELNTLKVELVSARTREVECQKQMEKLIRLDLENKQELKKNDLQRTEWCSRVARQNDELNEEKRFRKEAEMTATALASDLDELKNRNAALHQSVTNVRSKAEAKISELEEEMKSLQEFHQKDLTAMKDRMKEEKSKAQENLSQMMHLTEESLNDTWKKKYDRLEKTLKERLMTEVQELTEEKRILSQKLETTEQRLRRTEEELSEKWKRQSDRLEKTLKAGHAAELEELKKERTRLIGKIQYMEKKVMELTTERDVEEAGKMEAQRELHEKKIWKTKYDKARSEEAAAATEKFQQQLKESRREKEILQENFEKLSEKYSNTENSNRLTTHNLERVMTKSELMKRKLETRIGELETELLHQQTEFNEALKHRRRLKTRLDGAIRDNRKMSLRMEELQKMKKILEYEEDGRHQTEEKEEEERHRNIKEHSTWKKEQEHVHHYNDNGDYDDDDDDDDDSFLTAWSGDDDDGRDLEDIGDDGFGDLACDLKSGLTFKEDQEVEFHGKADRGDSTNLSNDLNNNPENHVLYQGNDLHPDVYKGCENSLERSVEFVAASSSFPRSPACETSYAAGRMEELVYREERLEELEEIPLPIPENIKSNSEEIANDSNCSLSGIELECPEDQVRVGQGISEKGNFRADGLNSLDRMNEERIEGKRKMEKVEEVKFQNGNLQVEASNGNLESRVKVPEISRESRSSEKKSSEKMKDTKLGNLDSSTNYTVTSGGKIVAGWTEDDGDGSSPLPWWAHPSGTATVDGVETASPNGRRKSVDTASRMGACVILKEEDIRNMRQLQRKMSST